MEYKVGFCQICGRAIKVPADCGLTQIQWDLTATEKCKRSRKGKAPEYVRKRHEIAVRRHKATGKQA